MSAIHTTYPQFAPNQVLSSSHLNQLYDYLNEQGRLTRTHLIGTGIVCGLEAELNAAGTGITISRGCGVTSAGHLIIWDEDEPLEFRRPYTMPEDIDYPFFDLPDGDGTTYPLWELTTDRDDDADAVALTRDFLTGEEQEEGEGDRKVLLLLFECRVVDNRNCTPNSCDDKGRTVETAVRPLLIRYGDLEEIRRVLVAENPGVATYYSLSATHAERLSLPTLRAPRFDVTNSLPATTYQLFDSYRRTLSQSLLDRVQSALDAAYDSLSPLLPDYATNPFADRVRDLRFLSDGSLLEDSRALAYPYYFEHLVNLIQAYGELRLRAEELFSLCCPDDRSFPRHLVLHYYEEDGWSDELRHEWVSSPVQNRQSEMRSELASLFARMVAMLDGFELDISSNSRQPDIRITPSFYGRSLSDKAIPFYYDPTDLLRHWNFELSRRKREDENLGYLAPTWNATDDFVRNPLRYDPEPRNFLRIEGATGSNYLAALQNIRSQIDAYRLPIDLVALRTGGLTPEGEETVEFPEFQRQYALWRERTLGRLAEVAVRLYDLRLILGKENALPVGIGGPPQPALLQRLEEYRYLTGTLGHFYEINFSQHTPALPYYSGLHNDYIAPLLFLHYILRTVDHFPDRLADLDYPTAEQHLSVVQRGGRLGGRALAFFLNDAVGVTDLSSRLDEEELSDQLDELTTSGDLDALRALYAGYQEERTEILRRQLFGDFQREHPGLQFRAGTELGGTFILVYHGAGTEDAPFRQGDFRLSGVVLSDGQTQYGVNVQAVGTSLGTTTQLNGMFSLKINYLPVTLRFSIIGAATRDARVVRDDDFIRIDLSEPQPTDDEREIEGLAAGTVVADFYLPYRCCGGGMPIHIFPEAEEPAPDPLTADIEQVSCTRSQRQMTTADVEVTTAGGTPPYFIEDEQGNRRELPEGPFEVFGSGTISVVDSGGQRVELTFTLLPVLSGNLVGTPRCDEDNQTFSQDFTITGGRPPYRYIDLDGNQVDLEAGETATLEGIPSGEGFTVPLRDEFGENCGAQLTIPPHTCTEPAPAPSATATSVGCTTEDDGEWSGSVRVEATGGTPPYFRITSDGDRAPLDGEPIAVFEKEGTIELVDAKNDTFSVNYQLSPPLTVTAEGEPECAESQQTFAQSFRVSGGTPPYFFERTDETTAAMGSSVLGNLTGIPSGQSFTLRVWDSADPRCEDSLFIPAETCTDVPDPNPDPDPTCAELLPCGGMAVRESFPFWLHSPTNAFTEYRQVTIEVEGLTVTTDEQQTVKLENDARNDLNLAIARTLAQRNQLLNEGNFNATMGSVTQQIEAAIRNHIDGEFELPQEGGSLLTLEHEANPSFDRLTVERYECYDYELVVRVEYGEAVDNQNFVVPRVRTLTYRGGEVSVQMSIEMDNQPEMVEANARSFDRFRVNRCEPNEAAIPLCPNEGPGVQIGIEGRGPARQLRVVGGGRRLQPYWEVGFGVPPVSNERSFGAGFIGNDRTAPIRLLVVDPETGCFAIATDSVGL